MAESVAEKFFLVAVDDIGGRSRIRADLLHSGVTGGVFADLALKRFIKVNNEGVVLPISAIGATIAADAAGAHVVDAVARRGSPLSVRRWIEEIGSIVFELTCEQLVDAAVIRREQAGGLRRHPIYPPVDLVAAATPRLELARMLRDPRRFTLVSGVVAVLVDVTGLAGTFSADRHKAVVREIMGELADHLPGDLRAIVAGVRTAAGHRAVTPQ